ncbi:MAG: rhamnogalacturonan lyase B N-terminal domain-containing protein [Cellvibrio sp.]
MKTASFFKKLCTPLCVAAALTGISVNAQAEFSISATKSAGGTLTHYTIDTDAGLVFTVRAYDNGSNTQAAGDIGSLKYNGVEYSDQSRGTQLNSGADWLYTGISAVGVTAELVDADGNSTAPAIPNDGETITTYASDFIKITLTSDNLAGGVLTHYYLIKRGEPRIYMGTHFTQQPTVHGQVRFLIRAPIAVLPNGSPIGAPNAVGAASPNGTWTYDIRQTSGAIESADVFGITTGDYAGETRSKHYSNEKLKDWKYLGGTNATNTVGLWMVRDNHEGDSGGPFYRSLIQQITATTNEITYMINYGEAQTEPFRLNRLNHYMMIFTDGSTPPSSFDTSWFGKMNLLGYVAPEGRGSVRLQGILGKDPRYPYTVAFANADAQYWADADHHGHATATGMLPGIYTMKIYKNELAVASRSVTVNAGSTTLETPIHIEPDPLGPNIGTGTSSSNNNAAFYINAGDPSLTPALFRIGEWDGTPQEFVNGDKVTKMHPQDIRMGPWSPGTYIVGTSVPKTGWPAFQWKDTTANGPLTIQFKLKPHQVAAANKYKLRVGITSSYNRARPVVNVNGVSSGVPGISPQPTTRTLTVGSYRGNNTIYDFNIPASQLVAGINTLQITPASGTAGTKFLSPGYSFDAIDLVKNP